MNIINEYKLGFTLVWGMNKKRLNKMKQVIYYFAQPVKDLFRRTIGYESSSTKYRPERYTLFVSMSIMLMGTVFLNACKDQLNTPVTGSLDKELLQNEKGVDALLIGAYAGLTGPHSSLGKDAASNWIYGSVAGGEAHKGTTLSDQPPINSFMDMSVNASNGFLNTFWQTRYEGVTRSNSVLEVLSSTDDLSEEKKIKITGEARFLRAHFYFELKKVFNNVPWIDENAEDYQQPNAGPDAVDIWKKIEEDFSYAYQNLPETQSDPARANKWAAGSYLAKAYIFQGKWSQAIELLEKVINQGVTASGDPYKLQDYYGYNFRGDHENSSEAVFSVQFVGKDGTGTSYNSRRGDRLNFPQGGAFSCCGFFQPTQDLVNSFRTNEEGLPYVEDYNQHSVKNDMGIFSDERFTLDQENLDPRLDYTVGRRGVPYKDWGPHPGKKWIRLQEYGGPYSPLKHVYRRANREQYSAPFSYGSGSALNYDIIRFAQVLLWAAEAEVELGNLDQARQYVNRVRGRVADDTYGEGWTTYTQSQPTAIASVGSEAEMLSLDDATKGDHIVRTDTKSTFVLIEDPADNIGNWQEYKDPNYKVSTYPAGHPAFSNKESARAAVHFEYKIELAMEGHRFFQLSRWGEAEEKLNRLYQYMGNLGFNDFGSGHFESGRNEYFPIPQNQIDLSVVDGEPTLKQNQRY